VEDRTPAEGNLISEIRGEFAGLGMCDVCVLRTYQMQRYKHEMGNEAEIALAKRRGEPRLDQLQNNHRLVDNQNPA